jgi:DNA-binding NarL/FixJ family response regulator
MKERTMNKTTILLASRSDTVYAFIAYIFVGRVEECILSYVHDEATLEERLTERTPDILLIETSFAHSETPKLIARLTRDRQGLRVVAFALDECPPRYAAIFISRGAESFLCFRASYREIRRAVDLIIHGKSYLPLAVEKAVNDRDLNPVPRGALTAREREVGRLIATGFTVQEIAVRLDVSTKTVDSHRTHLYEKTNSRRRSDFVAYAIRAGLIEREDGCSYA